MDFKPRVIFQDGFAVVPYSGEVKELEVFRDPYCLYLNRWEVNEEGIKKSVVHWVKHNSHKDPDKDVLSTKALLAKIEQPTKKLDEKRSLPAGKIERWRGRLKETADDFLSGKAGKACLIGLPSIFIAFIASNMVGVVLPEMLVSTVIGSFGAVATTAAALTVLYGGAGLIAAGLKKNRPLPPGIGEAEAKIIEKRLADDIEKMPERTKNLIRHIDPFIFAASDFSYLKRRRDNWTRGLCIDGITVLLKTPCIGKFSVVFEELRHLIHRNVLGDIGYSYRDEFMNKMTRAFLEDKKSYGARSFMNKHGNKRNWWKDPEYKSDSVPGREALVECDFIVCNLIKERRISEDGAIDILEQKLPNIGKLYREYINLECKWETKVREERRAKGASLSPQPPGLGQENSPEHLKTQQERRNALGSKEAGRSS